MLQELNADGSMKEEHTHAKTSIPGIAQVIESYRPAQADPKIYPVMDPRGTITKYLKSDGTTVVASREYDAFGNLIPNSGTSTWPGRLGYQGQGWMEAVSSDGAQRLLLSPTRVYDAATGRFVSKDPLMFGNPAHAGRQMSWSEDYPIGNSTGSDFYSYVGNSPTERCDPLGLEFDKWPVEIKYVRKLSNMNNMGLTTAKLKLTSECQPCDDEGHNQCWKIKLFVYKVSVRVFVRLTWVDEHWFWPNEEYWIRDDFRKEFIEKHEMKHAKAWKQWHDDHLEEAKALNTDCSYLTLTHCRAWQKDKERRLRDSFSATGKQEREHRGEDWEGYNPPTIDPPHQD